MIHKQAVWLVLIVVLVTVLVGVWIANSTNLCRKGGFHFDMNDRRTSCPEGTY